MNVFFSSNHEYLSYENKCDAIILDIDGTIWNTTGVVTADWNLAIDELRLPALVEPLLFTR